MSPVRVFDGGAALAAATADLFASAAAEAVAERGLFAAALAGGSTPLPTYRRLAAPPHREGMPWRRVHIFFSDERRVAAGHPERNETAARAALLDHVPLPAGHLHTVEGEHPRAAARYEETLRAVLATPAPAVPRLDLILLGLGEDGHTASLFPGHPALEEGERLVVAVEGAPKPPPRRVSFTLPLLRAARRLAVLATGTAKHRALRRAVAGDPELPAGRLAAGGSQPLWLVDRAAWEGA